MSKQATQKHDALVELRNEMVRLEESEQHDELSHAQTQRLASIRLQYADSDAIGDEINYLFTRGDVD